jgi:hypothetical protein
MHYMQRAVATAPAPNSPLLLLPTAVAALAERAQHSAETLCTLSLVEQTRQQTNITLMATGVAQHAALQG